MTNWILAQLQRINPYTAKDGSKAWIWATGFLASCLARILIANPRRLQEFRDLIKDSKNQ